jgi:hypothetical protein
VLDLSPLGIFLFFSVPLVVMSLVAAGSSRFGSQERWRSARAVAVGMFFFT